MSSRNSIYQLVLVIVAVVLLCSTTTINVITVVSAAEQQQVQQEILSDGSTIDVVQQRQQVPKVDDTIINSNNNNIEPELIPKVGSIPEEDIYENYGDEEIEGYIEHDEYVDGGDYDDEDDIDDEDYESIDEYNRKKNSGTKITISFNGTIPNIPEIEPDGYVTVEYGLNQLVNTGSEQYENCTRILQFMHQYMYGTVYMASYNASTEQQHNDNMMNNNQQQTETTETTETTTLDDTKKLLGNIKIKEQCQLRDENCIFWAAIGECDVNPAYMKIHCAPACGTCDQLLFENRCPIPSNLTDGNCWQAGDLHSMFTNITTHPYYKETYGPITVVLQPGMIPNKSTNTNEQIYNDSPWVVTIDDFLTVEECTTLIQLGAKEGYERSEDVGEELFDGTFGGVRSKDRTSTNAWCANECFNNSITQRILSKIENLTGIPDTYSEHLQILQYDVGQFYKEHHDYIEHDIDRHTGVRILTVFLYLSNVDAGGGTNFPQLGVTVMPKVGRVLIWPSVLNDNPNLDDQRTMHQALPVEQGKKYGANAWIHLRDFKTPHNQGCT